MMHEYILDIENLEVFVDTLIDDDTVDLYEDEYDDFYHFCIGLFDDELALVVNDEYLVQMVDDFHADTLSDSMRDLVKTGVIDLFWDSDSTDFVFRIANK